MNLVAQTPSRLATERAEEPECLLHLAVQQEVKEEASKTIFNLLVTPILSRFSLQLLGIGCVCDHVFFAAFKFSHRCNARSNPPDLVPEKMTPRGPGTRSSMHNARFAMLLDVSRSR